MGSFILTIIFPVIAITGAAVQLARSRQPRTLGHASEVFLVWLLVVWAGIGSVLTFLSHTLFADQTAKGIGWPTGNPFQTEVAVANLAVDVLGILCYWITAVLEKDEPLRRRRHQAAGFRLQQKA